ncbi:serine hydrolase [Tenacibaculum sp. SG-28]|uniref:serine hydrolase domain-containing protein n=1 Tax=Tenacibaculum sp. SG-28 TaxID=754426 RepID=UPI0021013B4F|nr:serine hydrolase domain-containing protein [Tenacibaculum sp. SG-28]
MRKISTLLVLCLVSYLSFSQNLENKIDAIITTKFKNPNKPGGVFMVSKNGRAIYAKAFGMANLELSEKMTTENVFQIGSMTKQFTAVAILILEERGKLSLQDPISKFIPDYPNGNSIKIYQLLNHTSGIKNFTKMKSIFKIAQKNVTKRDGRIF